MLNHQALWRMFFCGLTSHPLQQKKVNHNKMNHKLSRLKKIVEIKEAEISKIEFALAVISLSLISGSVRFIEAFLHLPLDDVIYLLIYIFACFHLARYKNYIFRLIKDPSFLFILCILPLISTFWSVSPAVTLRYAITYLGTTLFGMYLGIRFPIDQQLKVISLAIGAAAIFSLLIIIIQPELGVMQVGDLSGDWKGLYNHKNQFGRVMSLGMISSLIYFMGAKGRQLHLFILLLELVCLAGSRSGTSTVSLCIGIFSVLYFQFIRHAERLMVSVSLYLVSILILGGRLLPEIILNLLGKDMTLTGRTELWPLVIDAIKQKPFFGYGYGAFWGIKSESIWRTLLWEAPHSHNGALEISLQLGIIGLLFFVISIASYFIRSAKLIRQTKFIEYLFPAVFFVILLQISLSEAVVMKSNSLFWVLCVSSMISVFKISCIRDDSKEFHTSLS